MMTGKQISAMFSSAKEEGETSQDLYDRLDAKYHFTLDPCATPQNAKCARFFTAEQDGLAQKWDGVVFCNPPYGRSIKRWVRKAWDESKDGTTVVMLLPARTDTEWFRDYCKWGKVEFLRGRLHFGGYPLRAPFPSMIVTFEGRR